MTFPVLDDHTRSAEIIGFASTAQEAQQIAEQALRDAGNDDEDISKLKSEGVLTYNFRSGTSVHQDQYDDIEQDDLKNGFFDNA